MAAVNWPMPCMAKTDPIMAPLHFVVANLDKSETIARALDQGIRILLGRDDRRQRVVAANPDSHQHAPKDNDPHHRDAG